MWPVPESTPGWTAQVLENQGQVRRCVQEENRNGREQREAWGWGTRKESKRRLANLQRRGQYELMFGLSETLDTDFKSPNPSVFS